MVHVVGFLEGRKQNDSSSCGNPVRDPCVTTADHETEFADRAVELSSERFVEKNSLFGETINVESCANLRLLVEGEVPLSYFILQFNRTPRHSVDAIIWCCYSAVTDFTVVVLPRTDERGKLYSWGIRSSGEA